MGAVVMSVVAVALTVSAALLRPMPAAAHDIDVTSVARIFIDELGEGRYMLSVVDAQAPTITDPQGVLPARCHPVEDAAVEVSAGFVFQCDGALAAGDVLTLPWTLAGVVALARWADGSDATAYFRGRGATVPIEIADLQGGFASGVGVAGTYFMLGVEHILLGVDHLLFVLGLLLLVRGFHPLVKTITAFTLAHSITLCAAALGFVPIDRAPIEAAIALSIVLLAREVVVADRGLVHLTHRKPWLVAFIFGLLHGLGFAGALGDIGLPDRAIPLALLFFNVGVEAGQLFFVCTLIVFGAVFARPLRAHMPKLQPVLGYALGALATLWFFDRLPAIWG
jgi:hypothetical protein